MLLTLPRITLRLRGTGRVSHGSHRHRGRGGLAGSPAATGSPPFLSRQPPQASAQGPGGALRGGHRGWGAQNRGERAATAPPGVLKGWGEPHAASPQKTGGRTPGGPPQNGSFLGGNPRQRAGPQPPSPHSPRVPLRTTPQALQPPPRAPCNPPRRPPPLPAMPGPAGASHRRPRRSP